MLVADAGPVVAVHDHQFLVDDNRSVTAILQDIRFQKGELLIRQGREQLCKIGPHRGGALRTHVFGSGILHVPNVLSFIYAALHSGLIGFCGFRFGLGGQKLDVTRFDKES